MLARAASIGYSLGHVHLYSFCVGEIAGERLGCGEIKVGDQDLCACSRQLSRGGCADAAGATGYQRYLAIQPIRLFCFCTHSDSPHRSQHPAILP